MAFKLKKQHERSTLVTIKDKNGIYKREKFKITLCFREFYPDLYTPKSTIDKEAIRNYLELLRLPAVTNEQNKELTQPITGTEILKVLSVLPERGAI